MDKVEKLYKNFGILADAKDKIGEHEKEFLEILEAVKGSSNEKRLASQFIARFYKHFPNLIDQAIDAQLDLCEDDDISIRKQAIKDLPSLCKDNQEHLLKIADVLAQLLQTEDVAELSTVHNSLMTLFKIDANGTLRGLFSQILTGEDIVRERALKFLSSKLKTLEDEVLTKEAEECLLLECKKVLQDVTAAEFLTVMQILTGLKIAKTLSGQQQLVDILVEQAELDKTFKPNDTDVIDRLIQCGKHVLPFLSAYVPSSRFVVYMVTYVFPCLSDVDDTGSDLQLELVKLFAELSTHCGALEDMSTIIRTVYEKLLEYMPLPPTEENSENSVPQDDPKLEFSYVECLMYAFHQLGRRCPEFLTSDDNAELLKDFKLRLQYFARGIQGYIKKLRESLQGMKAEELKTDENKLKVVALKTTSNINTLIRDLFHSPPSYKNIISLSWKPLPVTTAAAAPKKAMPANSNNNNVSGTKRSAHTPITFDDGTSKPPKKVATGTTMGGFKGAREIYSPPSGKYSQNVKNFNPTSGGTFSGVGGGGSGSNRGNKRGRGYGSRGRGGRNNNRGNWFY